MLTTRGSRATLRGLPCPAVQRGLIALLLTLSGGTAGAAPAVHFSADRLAFGNQIFGLRSAPQSLAITNSGSSPLIIRSVTLIGADPADFVVSADSGEAALAPGSARTLAIQFRPNPPFTLGTRSAAVMVSDNGPGSPHLVSLAGDAVATFLNRSPRSVDFGNVPVGAVSGPQTITVRNDGNTDLTIGHIAPYRAPGTDGFWWQASLPVVLHAGDSFSLPVWFHPTIPFRYPETLYIYDSTPFSPHMVSLTGTGVAASSPPSAPTNLAARLLPQHSENLFHLSWTNNSTSATGIQVLYWTSNNPGYKPISTLGPGVAATDIGGQQVDRRPGTWFFQVRAVNDRGASGWSNRVAIEYPYPPDPWSLGGRALSKSQVLLGWTDTPDGKTVFAVWRRDSSVDWQRIAVVAPDTYTYTDTGLAAGTTYTYQVRAIRSGFASNFTNDVSVKTPAGP